MATKGVRYSVFRDADGHDCTNGGVSSKVAEITLVGPDVPERNTVRDAAPAFRIKTITVGGVDHLSVEPVDQPKGMIGPMFGGNYAICHHNNDGLPHALPIHDRFETQAQYDANFD